MIKTGEQYMLPMVSVKDSIYKEIEEGRWDWEDYSDDESHPHVPGHKYVSEMLIYCMETIAEKTGSDLYNIPSATVFGNYYESVVFLNQNNFQPADIGAFTEDTSDIKALLYGGWKRPANGGGEPFIFNISAKEVYLVYWETPGYGGPRGCDLEVIVNGEQTIVIEGRRGWGNPQFARFVKNDETTDHAIELLPEEGRGAFWIIGIAYIP